MERVGSAGTSRHEILESIESPYFRPGTESVLMAASMEQGRIVFRFARELLDDDPAYKFADSYVRSSITHIATRTSIRLISSNAKGAMGSSPLSLCVG